MSNTSNNAQATLDLLLNATHGTRHLVLDELSADSALATNEIANRAYSTPGDPTSIARLSPAEKRKYVVYPKLAQRFKKFADSALETDDKLFTEAFYIGCESSSGYGKRSVDPETSIQIREWLAINLVMHVDQDSQYYQWVGYRRPCIGVRMLGWRLTDGIAEQMRHSMEELSEHNVVPFGSLELNYNNGGDEHCVERTSIHMVYPGDIPLRPGERPVWGLRNITPHTMSAPINKHILKPTYIPPGESPGVCITVNVRVIGRPPDDIRFITAYDPTVFLPTSANDMSDSHTKAGGVCYSSARHQHTDTPCRHLDAMTILDVMDTRYTPVRSCRPECTTRSYSDAITPNFVEALMVQKPYKLIMPKYAPHYVDSWRLPDSLTYDSILAASYMDDYLQQDAVECAIATSVLYGPCSGERPCDTNYKYHQTALYNIRMSGKDYAYYAAAEREYMLMAD